MLHEGYSLNKLIHRVLANWVGHFVLIRESWSNLYSLCNRVQRGWTIGLYFLVGIVSFCNLVVTDMLNIVMHLYFLVTMLMRYTSLGSDLLNSSNDKSNSAIAQD
jgi:cobalamin biosynthesis protein CobD/CbiB